MFAVQVKSDFLYKKTRWFLPGQVCGNQQALSDTEKAKKNFWIARECHNMIWKTLNRRMHPDILIILSGNVIKSLLWILVIFNDTLWKRIEGEKWGQNKSWSHPLNLWLSCPSDQCRLLTDSFFFQCCHSHFMVICLLHLIRGYT